MSEQNQKQEEEMTDVEFLDLYWSDEFKCYLRWKSKPEEGYERDAFIGLYELKQQLSDKSLRQFLDKEKEEMGKRLGFLKK